jgi:hypothetical protein
MKDLIKQLLRENLDSKLISINYLKQLLNNTTNKSAQKILLGWISNGGEKIQLSPKQYNLLKVIQKGGPSSKFYHSKN